MAATLQKETPAVNADTERWQCPICGRQFKRWMGLRRHLPDCASKLIRDSSNCPACGKKFRRKTQLEHHISWFATRKEDPWHIILHLALTKGSTHKNPKVNHRLTKTLHEWLKTKEHTPPPFFPPNPEPSGVT